MDKETKFKRAVDALRYIAKTTNNATAIETLKDIGYRINKSISSKKLTNIDLESIKEEILLKTLRAKFEINSSGEPIIKIFNTSDSYIHGIIEDHDNIQKFVSLFLTLQVPNDFDIWDYNCYYSLIRNYCQNNNYFMYQHNTYDLIRVIKMCIDIGVLNARKLVDSKGYLVEFCLYPAVYENKTNKNYRSFIYTVTKHVEVRDKFVIPNNIACEFINYYEIPHLC